MAGTEVVVEGLLRPDGSLEVTEKVNLPPGRVRVRVEAAPEAGEAPADLMCVLERIWADRRARGARPRTVAEIDAGIDALRDASEDELREVEGAGASARRTDGKPRC